MIELPTELRERTSENLARNRTKSGFRQCLKKKGKKKKRKIHYIATLRIHPLDDSPASESFTAHAASESASVGERNSWTDVLSTRPRSFSQEKAWTGRSCEAVLHDGRRGPR